MSIATHLTPPSAKLTCPLRGFAQRGIMNFSLPPVRLGALFVHTAGVWMYTSLPVHKTAA